MVLSAGGRFFFVAAVIGWVAWGADAPALGQPRPDAQGLGPVQASTDPRFTRITGVRELADGSVLVLDSERESPLVRVAFPAGTTSIVARRGSGPGEFRNGAALWQLGGDTTLLLDGGLRRWLLVAGSRVVATVSPISMPWLGTVIGSMRGADRQGHLLAVRPVTADGAEAIDGMEDSVVVWRGSRLTGKVDTLLRVAGGRKGLLRRDIDSPIGPMKLVAANPLSVPDQAVLTEDGWIALARQDPYRVDWVAPDGRQISGRPIPVEVFAATEAEKRAAMARVFAPLPALRESPELFADWPQVLPPFDRDALLVSSEGWLVIRRMLNAGARSERYDVIDRAGRRLRTIAIPLSDRIVGFGRGTVYTARRTEDDLEALQRHRWP